MRYQYPGFTIQYQRLGKETNLFWVKSTPETPVNPDEIKTLLLDYYDSWDNTTPIEIIPVKYDHGELKRWEITLNRFAQSPGNTIPLIGASIGSNRRGYHDDSIRLIPGAQRVEALGDLRRFLVVWTREPQELNTHLPALLQELGIPQDAVGIIAKERDYTGSPGILLEGSSSSSPGPTTIPNPANSPLVSGLRFGSSP